MALRFAALACTALIVITVAPGAVGATAPGAFARSSSAPNRTASVAGAPRFFNFVTPDGVAESAGEPSIGSNWTTEQSFSNSNGPIPNGGTTNYFGGFMPYMLKATFDDCSSPATVTWGQKTLLTANTTRVFGDPILFTDHATGRTFVTQEEGLTPAGSTTDFTDNDGDSFLPSQGSGAPSCVDHETVGGGPFHAPLSGTTLYPNAVYYASQCIADATIALSVDGGVTFNPSVPMFTAKDCAGLHGHIKVAPDGTVYVPDKACGPNIPLLNSGNASAVVSEDNGTTWAIRPIPDGASMGEWDPSIGIGSDGTVYLGYQGADGHARIAVSHDKGVHWSASVDVGTPGVNVQSDTAAGIHNIAFPEVVSGDPDRATFAFLGTTTADGPGSDHTGGSNNDPALFSGAWYLYVSSTFDGGQTWVTQNLTPGDPVQRGPICGGGNCRNLLDFFDITIDKEGRVLVGWVDGCLSGCIAGGPNSNTAKATISRQCGGRRMLAAFDPVEPAIPQAPALAGTLGNGQVRLSWQQPDAGGAPITAYKVYRRAGDGNPFTLAATVTQPAFTDLVNPTIANTYRVTAVNALGEGPYCLDYQPPAGPVATACVTPGLMVVSDVAANGTDNDSGQNTPPDATVNIRSLSVAEPYLGPGVSRIVFTLQMTPGGSTIPPTSQWYVIWNRKTPATDGSDRRFVCMKTDASGTPSFSYGDFGPPLPLDGTLPPANANTPTTLGSADAGSFDPASGVLTITLAAANADAGGLHAGDALAALNARTFLAKPDGGTRSQNIASDITDNGNYTLVGNGACFCSVDRAPVASLAVSRRSGPARLTVQFDATGSSDPDGADGDGVGSYTFNFGDGGAPVTQSSPVIQHTYTAASGTSGYFATLTVNDVKCGQVSANVASANIEVDGSTTDVPAVASPLRFRIGPVSNPAHGGAAFALQLPIDGIVHVRIFSADGRRVGDLADAWMPAGEHSLNWGGTDDAGERVAPGVYLVQARIAGRTTFSRVVLLQ